MGIFDSLFKKKEEDFVQVPKSESTNPTPIRFRFKCGIYPSGKFWHAEERDERGRYEFVSGTTGESFVESKERLKAILALREQEPIYWDGKS